MDISYLDAGWIRLWWFDVNWAGGSPICSMSSFRLTRWCSGLDGGREGLGIMLLPVELKIGCVACREERLGGSGISLRATDIVSQVEPSVLDQLPPAVFTDILKQSIWEHSKRQNPRWVYILYSEVHNLNLYYSESREQQEHNFEGLRRSDGSAFSCYLRHNMIFLWQI